MSKILDEYKKASYKEIWLDGVLSNFVYGILGSIVIVAITIGADITVLLSYLAYYFYLGKVVNRPKYVTSLGKFIVFPIPTAIGAFVGYKIAPILIKILI
tara:strand:- start:1469 stop:1768 length:300 start_codon:yes stop_codon:yes gene_type:complete